MPIVNNNIDGYYDIEALRFGTKRREIKGVTADFPTLRIVIGTYHRLPIKVVDGVNPHMANQIWDAPQLKKLMEKNGNHEAETDCSDMVSEPETAYGTPIEESWPNDFDYIE